MKDHTKKTSPEPRFARHSHRHRPRLQLPAFEPAVVAEPKAETEAEFETETKAIG